MGTEHSTRGAALVTGSSGPVAGVIIARLQAAGYRVASLDETAGNGDLALNVDLADRNHMAAAVERVTRELGPISVLVTTPQHYDGAPFGEMSRSRWVTLLNAHLGATTNACRAVVPAMVGAGRGTVVTMSSWLALAGIPGESYYAAATGSILAFTKSFALEVAARGVRVNCVAIGPLESGAAGEEPVNVGDVADTVMFLIEDGDFFVGQVLSPAAGAIV